MQRNLMTNSCESSFLSVEKDIELILRRLFIESGEYSEDLKRLLVINNKDCLDNRDSEVYKKTIKETTLNQLRKKGYIRLEPKIALGEHAEVMSYILISIDNFVPNRSNPQFRDCIVHFDVICHSDEWDIGDYRLRPIKICGYIDGLLNDTKLSGIGTFQFLGCKELVLDDAFSGYTLSFAAIHGSDDLISGEE